MEKNKYDESCDHICRSDCRRDGCDNWGCVCGGEWHKEETNKATDKTMKNLQAKTVTRENAYEVWASKDGGSWMWYVLKKWQADDDKKFARWFCDVVTPAMPQGEMGDVYVSEIKENAVRIK